MDRKYCSLDELGYVGRGRSRHRPRDAPHLYGGPYPFVQTGDVKHSGLYLTEYSTTYSEAGLAQSRLWPIGTLCITIAANIADTAILGMEACFPDSIIGFIPNENEADARFIKYLFDAMLQNQYKQFTQGAAQDNLSQTKLFSLKFSIPSISEQQKIASILSSYDDLIENNRRRIKLLEAAARMLYKEWFVRLRFPGHEHVKVVDGVPEGWERKPLSELLVFHIGGGWGQDSYDSRESEPAYVIRGTDFSSVQYGNFDRIGLRYHKESSLKYRNLSPGDILLEISGGSANQLIGRSLLVNDEVLKVFQQRVICASFCKRLVPLDSSYSQFLYYFLKYIRDSGEISCFIKDSASALQNLNFKAFIANQMVIVPNNTILSQFAYSIQQIERQKSIISILINRTSAARDLLLPKLMNGEIAV